MRASTDRILTTHVGSLPRPDDADRGEPRARGRRGPATRRGFSSSCAPAWRPSCGTSMTDRRRRAGRRRVRQVDGAPRQLRRMDELLPSSPGRPRSARARHARPGAEALRPGVSRADEFRRSPRPDALRCGVRQIPKSGITTGPRPATGPVCVGPLRYTGGDAIRTDIANFKAALDAAGIAEGFMTAIAPGSTTRMGNAYYKTDEEFLFARRRCHARRVPRHRRGGTDPAARRPGARHQLGHDQSRAFGLDDYRKYTMMQVAALNHAISGLPRERIRYHLCWGSWHGPHTTDIPLRDIVEVMLAVNARRLLVRGRQRPPRARMEGVAGREAARTTG